jgi:hypothetical protein
MKNSNECPKCAKAVLLKPGSMGEHFKKEHPEFKFHRNSKDGKSALVCDTCGNEVHTFKRLVTNHSHPEHQSMGQNLNQGKLTDEQTKQLRDLATIILAVLDENVQLKAELGRLHQLLEFRTSQVVKAQDALADVR